MKMKYLPFFILLMTTGTTLSYATDGEIKIMAGKTGYVGEVVPVTKLAETMLNNINYLFYWWPIVFHLYSPPL